MKKRTQKLILAKETVRGLESGDLREIHGGTINNTVCEGCYSGGVPTCYPSYNTCATRLC
ncbi:MAG TPA: hypothetical protein VN851_17955 [Thermoanaerobaculia bacterium]|nr:hypothetical protein [Thermoanaerobaculia bacterium]